MLSLFLRRLMGAALLDASTYEDIEADPRATPHAAAVVLLSSLAAGIGLTGSRGTEFALAFFAVASVLALGVWVAFALITLQVGTRSLATPETVVDIGQLLRTLGFATAPGLLQVFALFSPAPILTSALAFAWTMAASVVAVQHALDFQSTKRALAVCLVGWGLPLAIAATLATVVSSQ